MEKNWLSAWDARGMLRIFFIMAAILGYKMKNQLRITINLISSNQLIACL